MQTKDEIRFEIWEREKFNRIDNTKCACIYFVNIVQ